jgi:hypothetical protein
LATQPLNLKCDILVSKFGFSNGSVNLCRYNTLRDPLQRYTYLAHQPINGLAVEESVTAITVGLVQVGIQLTQPLTPPDSSLKGAWYPGGFNP